MRWVVLACLLVLVSPPSAAGERARVLEAPYAGQPVGLDCGFELPVGECPDAPGSHVQFGPFPPPSAIDLRLEDATGARVGAELVFHDEAGEELARAAVCDHVKRLPVPAGTAYVRVLVDTAITDQHCPNVVPFASVGTVTLRLR